MAGPIFSLCNFVMYCTPLMMYMMACIGDGGEATVAKRAFWFVQNDRGPISVCRDPTAGNDAVALSQRYPSAIWM